MTYFGKEAERLRGIYRQFSQQEIEKFYDDAVGERFGPFEKITSIQIHDDVTKNAFSLKSGYRLDEFWKENEEEQHDYFTVFPQYLMDSLDFAINPSREAPLALDHPAHIVEYTTIIDTESDWDQEPLKKKLESDDLAFHYTKKSEGNTLTLRYEFHTKQDHVPVERLGEHRKHMQSIEDLLFTTITFSRGNSDEIWAELFANDNYILLGSLTICYAWVIYMLVRKTKKEGNNIMKWFEKEEIKDKEKLSPEQIDYLCQPSVAIFVPFNSIFRKQWDNLFVSLLLVMAGQFLTASEDVGLLTALFIFINIILEGCIFYFFTKHSRRLAWNRCQWKDFETFEKSEKKWLGAFGGMIGFLGFSIFKKFQEGIDVETWIFVSLAFLFFGGMIALPYFQAWRKQRACQN